MAARGGRRVRHRHGGGDGAVVVEDSVPLLVQVLAGNSVTGTTVFACLTTDDTCPLRCLHPAIASAVASLPWDDSATPVADIVAWRAALPAATVARFSWDARVSLTRRGVSRIAAALVGLEFLDCKGCRTFTNAALSCLPPLLRVLDVSYCNCLTPKASFRHLTGLELLDCTFTDVVAETISCLPPSLTELRIDGCSLAPTADFRHLSALKVLTYLDLRGSTGTGASRMSSATVATLPPSLQELEITIMLADMSLAHLPQLRLLFAAASQLDDHTLASLPPGLLELEVNENPAFSPSTTFAHLHALRTLSVNRCGIGDASLASLPPSLVKLHVRECRNLTDAATLSHLPSLQELDISGTGIGDAMVASLPPGLVELRMNGCRHVTRAAALDHLRSLRVLHSYDTDLLPTAVAACRARGCTAPADGVLRLRYAGVSVLAVLPDGRLASAGSSEVRLWDVRLEGEAACVLQFDSGGDGFVQALAALPDGCRLAIGKLLFVGTTTTLRSDIEVWDVAHVPPVRLSIISSNDGVGALAALHGGRLAAAYDTGEVQIIDVDAMAVSAVLTVESIGTAALAVLPDGSLATAGVSVGLWDVGARERVATLVGHDSYLVNCLAVLPDGRLAGGSSDGRVRLWDVSTRTCVAVMVDPTGGTGGRVEALAALPDGRLVGASGNRWNAAVWVWDTRPAAAALGSHAAAVPPATLVTRTPNQVAALTPLPDGRLAIACDDGVYLSLIPAAAPLPPPA